MLVSTNYIDIRTMEGNVRKWLVCTIGENEEIMVEARGTKGVLKRWAWARASNKDKLAPRVSSLMSGCYATDRVP